MNSVKPQSFFIILCIFLFFQAPISSGMDSENSTEDVIISTTTDRKLATPMSCYTQTCSESDSLDDDDYSYDYSISMGQNSVMRFEFTIAKEKTQLGLSLSATPSADIKTAFKLNPSDSWPYNYISVISGSNWNRDLTIESDSSTRTLIVVIENDSSYQSNVRFQIGVEEIESSNTWMAPVVSVVVAGAVIFFVICICCRIRRNRRIRRRMRAQAAYEVALRNAQAESNENNHFIQPQAQQNQHHVIQIIQIPAPAPNNQEYPLAPPIEMMSQVQNNPNNGPLSKDNFDKRFPERAGRMFKSSFPQKTCSICLEDLGKLEKCRQLYCEHIFHSECVKLWLLNQMDKQNNGFCPNCNKKMTFVVEKAKQNA